MTAIVTRFELLPLIEGNADPSREIERPMVSIIVGGFFFYDFKSSNFALSFEKIWAFFSSVNNLMSFDKFATLVV